MKLLIKLLFLPLAVLLFTGCNTYTDERMDIYQTNDSVRIQNINEEQMFNSYHQTYRMRSDENAQVQVELLKEVQSASVITINREAFVAVVLEEVEFTEILEKKISDQVKSTDDTIQNVFVSADQEFVNKMSAYREKLESGRSNISLTEQFNNTVEQFFPDAR
jgi:spore cortex protein